MEGKEDHSKSESDSEFDNMFNRLRKVAYRDSDNAGKLSNFYKLKKWHKNLFLLFYGKIGKGIHERTRSESEIEIEICQQLDENFDKLINATKTEHHSCDSAGMTNNPFNS